MSRSIGYQPPAIDRFNDAELGNDAAAFFSSRGCPDLQPDAAT
jgi:hypothetical protein